MMFLFNISSGDAYADRDGAEDVQTERVRLPQYERGGSEEQTHDHDAWTKIYGGGNQELVPPEEVISGRVKSATLQMFTVNRFVLVCERLVSW